MGAAFGGDCCGRRDGIEESPGQQQYQRPNGGSGRSVREFSFARGGWIERDEVTLKSVIQELQRHPGQFRELYICSDLPLLTSGARALKADCNRISQTEARALSHIFQNDRALQVLLLHGVRLSDSATVDHLFGAMKGANAAALHSLSLLSMELSGDSEAALADILRSSSWTTQLLLNGSRLSPPGAALIASSLRFNNSLEELDLESVGFGDNGAKALATALVSNSTLRNLALAQNGIGDSGVTSIAGALRLNRGLKRLDLRGNHISDAGARALASTLKANSLLERLDLRHNRLSAEAADTLDAAWQSNPSTRMEKLMILDHASEIFQQADEAPAAAPTSETQPGAAAPSGDPGAAPSTIAGQEAGAGAEWSVRQAWEAATRVASSKTAPSSGSSPRRGAQPRQGAESQLPGNSGVQRFATCPTRVVEPPSLIAANKPGLAGFGTAERYRLQPKPPADFGSSGRTDLFLSPPSSARGPAMPRVVRQRDTLAVFGKQEEQES
eukprot:TRINITY_DN21966_c0_g4_i1.p1 TRINITY_DN21966_c0_g4~~TRINITY_DN21966_c0_g4_i1.p1  ORF type:complete len:501 (+),score=123.98 TRINITY_DN21966_c0_g4_i1:115-1617(+)